jgi:hypothetical protein
MDSFYVVVNKFVCYNIKLIVTGANVCID